MIGVTRSPSVEGALRDDDRNTIREEFLEGVAIDNGMVASKVLFNLPSSP